MKNITIQYLLSKTNSNYEDIHKTGIYKIYHLKYPNIYYIGSANSDRKWRQGFKQRWLIHLRQLIRNTHHSIFLQRIVNKYGIEGIRLEIIEFVNSEKCIEREQFYLDALQPFGRKGYNTCKKAGTTLGFKFPENKKSKRKSIDQYNLEGNFIQNWDSLNQASRELNINVSSIKDCCKKRFKQIKGFIFRYKGDIDLPKSSEIRKKMIIDCIFDSKIMYSGNIKEIELQVPDSRGAIYNSIAKNILTENKWKYLKK